MNRVYLRFAAELPYIDRLKQTLTLVLTFALAATRSVTLALPPIAIGPYMGLRYRAAYRAPFTLPVNLTPAGLVSQNTSPNLGLRLRLRSGEVFWTDSELTSQANKSNEKQMKPVPDDAGRIF